MVVAFVVVLTNYRHRKCSELVVNASAWRGRTGVGSRNHGSSRESARFEMGAILLQHSLLGKLGAAVAMRLYVPDVCDAVPSGATGMPPILPSFIFGYPTGGGDGSVFMSTPRKTAL